MSKGCDETQPTVFALSLRCYPHTGIHGCCPVRATGGSLHSNINIPYTAVDSIL